MKLLYYFKNLIPAKNDNNGSVIVTVLVSFFLVSVLVAIILSTVTVNFQMRSIDRQTKDEFYYAEKALNDVYTGLGQDCSDIMGETYNSILKQYRGIKTGDTKYTYKDEEAAYADFVGQFVTNFKNRVADNHIDKFDKYIVKNTYIKSSSDKTSRAYFADDAAHGTIRYYSDSSRTAEKNPASEAKDIHCIVIEDVSIQSNTNAKENNGYVSQVTTDIVIDVPTVSFFNTNSRVFDYALLANNGIVFEEGAEAVITGNLYGGTLPFADEKYKSFTDSYEYGGIYLQNGSSLTIQDAQYVVSGGDIFIDGEKDQTTTFKVLGNNRNNQIWFENLEINGKADVEINGDVFAADDLQVNKDSDGTYVKINGSYYGYNDGNQNMTVSAEGKNWTLTTKKAQIVNKTEDGSDEYLNSAAVSSSIIMNSKNATIDMSELKTLLLLGNAYIDHNSLSKSDLFGNERESGVIDGKIKDVSFPESAALKASQDITLVPTEFLGVSNPIICTEGGSDPFEPYKASIVSKMNTGNWFGKSYINTSEPYTFIKIKSGSQVYAYCYLNFQNDQSKMDYVDKIIEGDDVGAEPTAATIRAHVLKSTEIQNGKILLDTTGSTTRLYAKNAVLGYDGTDLLIAGNNAGDAVFSSYSTNLYKRYRLLDTYLDPLADRPLSVADSKPFSGEDFKQEDNELPLGRFFWIWGLRKANERISAKTTDEKKAEEKKYGSNFVFVRDVSADGVDLCDKLSGIKNAFVIIDGNAYVKNDLELNGFIVCVGKLTVKKNKKLNVTFDSTLLNKRIAVELRDLEKCQGYHDENRPDTAEQTEKGINKMLIYYLMNSDRALCINDGKFKMPMRCSNIESSHMKSNQDSPTATSYREYKYISNAASNDEPKINTDYANFVYFDNWRKGQR